MKIKKILIANRGEIAIRISRACNEINIKTVSVYTFEDRYSLHRFKTDESYQIGKNNEPLKPYLDIHKIINVALECEAHAIHPGYGFLSENAEFADLCFQNNIIFIGPSSVVLNQLGNKIQAKKLAQSLNIPIIKSSKIAIDSLQIAYHEAEVIGYPVMIKAVAGGGGRGMRIIRTAEEFPRAFEEARNEARNAFNNEEVFLEKYLENPRHIEVQIVADQYGNVLHLYERDCSVQRRFQKVVESAPALGIKNTVLNQMYKYAVKLLKEVKYTNVGTVEFLVDQQDNIYFIEVNPRIQVEHTITEIITGVDIVRTQIFIAAGFSLNEPEIGLENQNEIPKNGFAIQCRITTENPKNDFKPDYGTLITYRNASGLGIRLDEGSTYAGMVISPFFDSMLVKISAVDSTFEGACKKMSRALREFRIRGVNNNIQFLENIISHPKFITGKTTVNFIQEHPILFKTRDQLDRGTRMLTFLADVSVNGNEDKKNEKLINVNPIVPESTDNSFLKGSKNRLDELGPSGFCEWLKNESKIYYTDTTFRDAHQSLLATRMRTYDMLKVASSYAKNFPQTFSMEAWGGATFDVCLRFLHEDPWQRLIKLRKSIPNILIQMLIRGSNGVGYLNYPDNLIESFVEKSWENGVDVFRVFDSLNWIENMAPCIEMIRKRTNGIAEGAVCYTGDILNKENSKYNIDYYLRKAKELENAGAHILCIKDMAGLLKPYAAFELISALKDSISLPIHLHTHDTSSLQAATYLKAIEAGVDVVDCAIGSLSGMTSQPSLNAIVEMMRFQERENPYNQNLLNQYSDYWEEVRKNYHFFETGIKTSTAEVFVHEIPGGQYSNLKSQANALGLGDKFNEIKNKYIEVNQMFGEIVKVTPSSKVVGDMAQFMVANSITYSDIITKSEQYSFPTSVVSYFLGEIGQPDGGFPEDLQKVIIKGKIPFIDRPNKHLVASDLENEFIQFKKDYGDELLYTDYLSYKFYPIITEEFIEIKKKYGELSVVPTIPFFYGLKAGEETFIEIEKGKTLLIKLLSIGPIDDNGMRTVFFNLNGQSRNIEIHDKKAVIVNKNNVVKVDKHNPSHIGAPFQGMIATHLVSEGDKVTKNQPLFVIEAMKMETTILSPISGIIKSCLLSTGIRVNMDDLIMIID